MFFPQHFIYFVSLLPQFPFQLCFISFFRKFSVSRLKIQNPSVLSYQEVVLRRPMLLLQEGREAEIESAAERRLCFTVFSFLFSCTSDFVFKSDNFQESAALDPEEKISRDLQRLEEQKAKKLRQMEEVKKQRLDAETNKDDKMVS